MNGATYPNDICNESVDVSSINECIGTRWKGNGRVQPGSAICDQCPCNKDGEWVMRNPFNTRKVRCRSAAMIAVVREGNSI